MKECLGCAPEAAEFTSCTRKRVKGFLCAFQCPATAQLEPWIPTYPHVSNIPHPNLYRHSCKKTTPSTWGGLPGQRPVR